MTRTTVAEPSDTKRFVGDPAARARVATQFLDRVAGLLDAQASGAAVSDKARQGRVLVGKVLRKPRISLLAWSAILSIGLPTLISAVYFGMIASDQYVTEVRFSIRGHDTKSVDILGSLTGMLGASKPLQDSYLVMNYLTSREAVDDLEAKVGLRAMFTRPSVDYFSRLEADAPVDDVVDYWREMASVSVDTTSNTVLVEIRGFTAEDAKTIGTALVEASESLINKISDRAREDAMRNAVAQAKETEKRLREVRETFRLFRDQQGNLDPVKTAEAMLALVSTLTQEKLLVEQDLAGRRLSLGPNAPAVLNLQSKLKTIDEQIRDFRSQVTQLGRTEQTALSAQLSRYENLRLDQEFAERTHASALAAIDMTRTDADRARLFIVPFVRPALAEDPRYPDRPLAVLVVLLGSAALWAVGTLIFYGVRDHIV